jgi:unsaturated rhamnogalacturonyl hydrolase
MIKRIYLLITALAVTSSAGQLAVGLTQSGTLIEAVSVPSALANAPTVLLIGGFSSTQSSEIVRSEIASYTAMPANRRKFHLLAIADANPQHLTLSFPPGGKAYRDDPESHYLWRWTGLQAPDLITIVGEDSFGFGQAASTNAVAGIGTIPARSVAAKPGVLTTLKNVGASPARQEITRRLARSPLEVATSLEPFYGHDFQQPVYIPAMALIARTRLGHVDDVRSIVAPFVIGEKDGLAGATASHLSGHLIFGELAEKTHDPAYVSLVRRAADLGFASDGSLKDAMPFHNEMSDSVFMGCPILAKAGKLTGEAKYFDMTLRQFRYMGNLCRRSDGLYRHSPLNEAAWGRGNAFPALGLALSLTDLPRDHPAFAEMLVAYRSLMAALSQFQDANGMWRQVIDKPGSYPEFSATAMIARSMLLGIRNGWVDAKEYQPRVTSAWRAIAARISNDGQVVDVCESTGKQKSLQDYLDREAILGRDPRAGGMAMMLAVEMASSN